jgi:hypothetical protein
MFAVMWSGHPFTIAVPPGREHGESGEIQELAEPCIPRKCKMTPHTALGALAAFHVCREVAGRVTAVARLEIWAGTVWVPQLDLSLLAATRFVLLAVRSLLQLSEPRMLEMVSR